MSVTTVDIENPSELLDYLRSTRRIGPGESPKFATLHGGVSNRTVLVERPTGESWVLKQALPKLRVDVDWFSDPARIHREALGLRYLPNLAPPGSITPLVFEDRQLHLLAMAAVPHPHVNFKTELLSGQVNPDHILQFAQILASIHRESAKRGEQLIALFDDRSVFESLRIEPYYRYTAQQLPESARFFERLIADTYSRRFTIVHGDYSPKNILIHNDRLILLDHEVIHFGDPAFDLGFSLAHLFSKAHHLPMHRAEFGNAIRLYWQTYCTDVRDAPWSTGLEEYAVRHSLACTLARVAGRSKLEYLTPEQRLRQRNIILELLSAPPQTIGQLLARFLAACG
jgi:aminoglycoside phosphotransferase (APT) family kinase protein